jgi:hypothetical protein
MFIVVAKWARIMISKVLLGGLASSSSSYSRHVTETVASLAKVSRGIRKSVFFLPPAFKPTSLTNLDLSRFPL